MVGRLSNLDNWTFSGIWWLSLNVIKENNLNTYAVNYVKSLYFITWFFIWKEAYIERLLSRLSMLRCDKGCRKVWRLLADKKVKESRGNIMNGLQGHREPETPFIMPLSKCLRLSRKITAWVVASKEDPVLVLAWAVNDGPTQNMLWFYDEVQPTDESPLKLKRHCKESSETKIDTVVWFSGNNVGPLSTLMLTSRWMVELSPLG